MMNGMKLAFVEGLILGTALGLVVYALEEVL